MSRAKMKVVGIGERVHGISKNTNNPYDFISVSFVFPDQRTKGYRAETVNVDTPDLPANIALNTECDVVFHYIKNKMYVDAIL